jgi:tight adherence protein B
MIGLAALAWGFTVFLAVGFACGRAPRFHRHQADHRHVGGSQQLWLQQAGVTLSPAQFWGGSIAVGVVALALLTILTGIPAIAFVPAVSVALLPRAYYGRRRAARLRAVQTAWPDGLRDVLAAISSGLSLAQAVTALAISGPEPLQLAFARFPLLSRMLGTVAALEVVKEELADPTSDRVIEVLILAHERGGQIVQSILVDLVSATAKDLKALDESESEGLEAKINARAVLVMPWFVLLALTAAAGPFRAFYQTSAGLIVVIIGALLCGLGYWLISRLSRDPIEQRVFGSAALAAEGRAR